MQYHLRAAYGYLPAAGSLPSYAHLGCDPKKDPTCKPKLVQKAPSGLYLQYPNCNPLQDPHCAYAASLVVCLIYYGNLLRILIVTLLLFAYYTFD